MGHTDTCDWITGEDGGTCTCGWNAQCLGGRNSDIENAWLALGKEYEKLKTENDQLIKFAQQRTTQFNEMSQGRDLLLCAAKRMVKLAEADMMISPNAFAIQDLREAIAFVEEAEKLESNE